MPGMNELFFYPPTPCRIPGAFAKSTGWQPSDAFLRRLARAYRIGAEEFSGSGASMWSSIAHRQRDIHEALVAEDCATLRTMLAAPARTSLYYGVDNLFPEHVREMRESPAELQRHAQLLADHVFRLGEALAVQRVPRPSGNAGDVGPQTIDVEAILARIETRIGHPLTFPNPFEDEFGIPTTRGLVSYRALLAVYQAWRMAHLGCRSVLEIGAGMGRTILFARTFGISDYTVVDLPMTLVGQACFIAAIHGEAAVHFITDEFDRSGSVRLVPPSRLRSLQEEYDLTLNVNSLTELDETHAKEYVRFALAKSRQFLSINHEENAFTVAELLEGAACRAERFPYWMRKGYVEEIFTPGLR